LQGSPLCFPSRRIPTLVETTLNRFIKIRDAARIESDDYVAIKVERNIGLILKSDITRDEEGLVRSIRRCRLLPMKGARIDGALGFESVSPASPG